MDSKDLRRRTILAPTPREQERWYALWLLGQGWTATAEILERDPYTIGRWAAAFCEGDPRAFILSSPEVPPGLGEAQQEELRAAVQELPAEAGIGLTNWTLRQAQEEIGLLVWMGTLRPQPVSQ